MGNDLAYRFTEERYCSKSDVMKELKTSLVDNIWGNILKFRQDYFINTGLRSIDSSPLLLCQSPAFFTNVVSRVESNLIRTMNEYSNIDASDTSFDVFEANAYINCLKGIAKSNNATVNEVFLKSVVRHQIMSIDGDAQLLSRYVDALDYIKHNYIKPIDSDFMLALHKIVSGSSFGYRNRNETNPENRVLIDRIYTSAPVNVLGNALTELFRFIENSDINTSVKASIVYYYVNLLKPFDKYTNEIAYLMAKAVLAHESMGDLAVYLPLEMFEMEDGNEIAKLYNEVQRYNDVTYFVIYNIRMNERYFTGLLDLVINFKTNQIKQEQYVAEPVNEPEPVKEPEPVVEEPVFVKEEIKPVVEEVKPEPKVIEKPVVKPTVTPKPVAKEVQPTNELAVSYIPPALDEKEMNRLEVHLLELDPELRKREAHFYARHCTLGKRYTIQEFKKCNNCVYETARTGMDHLAELGYYKKEPVKNKFVYTPILRK